MMLISVLSLLFNGVTVFLLLQSSARQRAIQDELLSVKNMLHRRKSAAMAGHVTPFRARIEGTDAS